MGGDHVMAKQEERALVRVRTWTEGDALVPHVDEVEIMPSLGASVEADAITFDEINCQEPAPEGGLLFAFRGSPKLIQRTDGAWRENVRQEYENE